MLTARFIRFFSYLNFRTLRRTVERAGKHRLAGLSAEMAYNAMLALFPAILALLTAIGIFQPLKYTFQRLAGQVSEVAPIEALRLIQDFADDISTTRNTGLFSVSFAIALWVSSGALSAAMQALDQIHQIPPEQTRPFWKAKLISLGLTIGTMLLLIIASILVFISELVVRQIAQQNDFLEPSLLSVWRLLTWPLALGIISTAFTFVYRFGPSQWSPGKPLVPGAVLAAVSWALLSSSFRLYVSRFGDYNRAYGAIGAVIILLLWLYMSSLVLLLGDELNVTVGEAMQERRAKQLSPSQPPESRGKPENL